MIGKIIDGRYQIESLLSSDFAGQLYQATDLSSERQVTIRFFDFIPAEEAQEKAKLLQDQFDVLATLDNPDLVPIINLGDYGSRPYLVAGYPEGVPLSSEAELAPLAMERVIYIGHEIGQLLNTLHQRGVVHGDLRPQNVLLQPTRGLPFVQLAGFGAALAQDLSAGDEPSLVYLAPERIRGMEPSIQADMYSLGAILYHLSTGILPSRQADGVTRANLPRQLNGWIPQSLEGLILELLATDPAARPADAGEVAKKLDQIGQNELFPPDRPPPSDEEELPGPPSWEL